MQHIVVGVDGSPQADRALRWAVREAELRLAMVDLVHCFVIHASGAVLPIPDREMAEARLDEVTERNSDVLERVKWTAATLAVPGSVSDGLVDAAEDGDLLVVGARGAGGFHHLRLGSTGYRTAAHATAPVAVIHDSDEALDARRPVVVGIDDSSAAARALRWAIEEAQRRDVALTVVHVYQPPPDPAMLASMAADLHAKVLDRSRREAEQLIDDVVDHVAVPSSVAIRRVVERGSAAEVLMAHAGSERMLVVGTRGRGALGRVVFGSVSHQCVQHASGPVVVVP